MYRIANPSQPKPTRALRAPVLGALLAILLITGAAAQTTVALQLRNGVVIDPSADVVYLMNPGGGIDAVNLTLGTVQWHSDAADRPIAASGAGILAQAQAAQSGHLQLALLDTSGHLLQSTTVALPAGVEAPVTDGLSHRVLINGAAIDGGQVFEVEWQSTFSAPRGALILDSASAPRIRTGAFTFNPATGVVVDAAVPSGFLAGPEIAVPESQRLPVPGRQYFSADASHRQASVPGVGSAADTYEWTLFDADGDRLGSFTNQVEYAPFYVSDGLVVLEGRPGARLQGEQMVEQPLSLWAVSLSNGVELWRIAIRDTDYRGPFPP